MKKTFTINISGTVFHIEEDAYDVLQKYLVKLKNHFGSEEEGKEILADIEARIAEIFTEKSPEDKNVITLAGVEEVIETMGTPEDFAEEEGEEEEVYIGTTKRKRRLYRDPEHRVVGGVCGGLAAYFNMDPVVMRIIFVVLLIVTSVVPALLAYLVLWIAVPKAVTTAQRLEMRGQEATVKNIEKSFREEVKEVKESYRKFKESETYAKSKKKVEGAGEVTYNVFKLLLKVIVVVIGVILIISGFFGLLGLISSLAIGHSFVQDWPLVWSPEINFPEFLNYLVEPGTVKLGVITVGFLAGIPLLAMLYVGSKLVFRYKSNNTAVGLSLVGVWLIALITLFVVSANQLGNFKNQASVVESTTVDCDSCQTLYLQLAEDRYKGYAAQGWDFNKLKVVDAEEGRLILGNPRLDVEKASGNSFVITVKKSSRGRTRETARDHASDLIYRFQPQDTVLLFEPYFFLNEGDKWRDQEVQITVKVPEGGTIFMDETMVDIIYDVENVTNTWDGDMIGKYWEMKSEGLTMRETAADSIPEITQDSIPTEVN